MQKVSNHAKKHASQERRTSITNSTWLMSRVMIRNKRRKHITKAKQEKLKGCDLWSRTKMWQNKAEYCAKGITMAKKSECPLQQRQNIKTRTQWNQQQESNITVAGCFVNEMALKGNKGTSYKNNERKRFTHSNEGRTLKSGVLWAWLVFNMSTGTVLTCRNAMCRCLYIVLNTTKNKKFTETSGLHPVS